MHRGLGCKTKQNLYKRWKIAVIFDKTLLLLLASALELTSECVIEFFLVLLSKIVGPHPISIESFRFDCV